MSNVIRRMSVPTVCAAIVAICSTGCMMSPRHGYVLDDTDDVVLFAGATTSPRQRIQIEAYRPSYGWRSLGAVVSRDTPYTDLNGTWYVWPADIDNGRIRVPAAYWENAKEKPGYKKAQLRAIIPNGGFLQDGLFTFKDGFSYSPFLSTGEQWEQWGHGVVVTIYKRR